MATLALSGRVCADEADAEPSDVLVQGGRAGGFVSSASMDDATREVTDAASLVAPMPGVHVRRLGADDAFATLSVRGTSSTQVAVYLAGVPLTGGADPTLDLATLPLWPGARARVYRSFAPAALGRGSLGGTLVLDAPSARAAPRTEAWAAVGSFGARRLRVGDVRGEPGSLRVATALSASRSDDDFTYLDPLATAQRNTDVFATRTNAGHAAVNGLASVALPVALGGEIGALTVTTLAQARRQSLPGTVKAPTPLARLDSTRMLSALELTLPAGGGTAGLRGWARREGLAIHDGTTDAALRLGPTSTDDAIVAAGGSLGWRGRPTEASSIELRVDGSGERYAPGSWVGSTQPPGATRSSAGAAFDGELQRGRLRVATSARGDAWVDAAPDHVGTADVRPTGHVGAEVSLDPFVIATHGGWLARPASFVERFGDRGGFIGDSALRPESAATVDLGARFEKRVGALTLTLESVTFSTWASDLIVFVPTGAYGRAKATNIGRARVLGLENEARARVRGLDLRISHTALATANESECRFVATAGGTSCERPPLPGRPEHDVVGDVAYTLGPVRLRWGVDLVTGIRADLTGETRVPDRVLSSAGARLAVPGARGLSVALDVRNLFDARVAEYEGALGPVRVPIGDVYEYPLPGRSFLASVRFTSANAPR